MTFEPDGGCGDAAFYALGRNGTSLLTVVVEQNTRSTTEPTMLEIDLPKSGVTLRLQRGVNLGQLVCSDVVENAHVDAATDAIAGSVTVQLDPRRPAPNGGCGVHGDVELHDVVMADGTPIADLRIGSEGIGCYAG